MEKETEVAGVPKNQKDKGKKETDKRPKKEKKENTKKEDNREKQEEEIIGEDESVEQKKENTGTIGEKENEAVKNARAEIDKLTGGFITELGEMIKDPDAPLEAKEECMRAVANMLGSTSNQDKYYGEMLEHQKARTPEAIHPPTIEKARKQLNDETLLKKDKKYERFVKNWFEERFRHLESVEQTFEEQTVLMEPVMTAYSLLELDSDIEIKTLGREMKEEFEARRKRQRMVRVWSLSPPRGVFESSGMVEWKDLKNVFTLRDKDGKAIVAEELRKFEREGQKLLRLKEEKGKIKKDKIAKNKKDEEIKNQERKIIENFTYGGEINEGKHKGERISQRLEKLKEKRKTVGEDKRKTIDKEISQLEELVWARRFSGGLWSMMGRAARYDVVLNGVGDFLTGRMAHIGDKLGEDPIHNKTKGIWSPKEGKYKGKPFDLGYRDFFTAVLSKATVKANEIDDGKKRVQNDPNLEVLGKFGVKKENIIKRKELTKIEDPGGGKTRYEEREKIDWVDSLENFEFENEDFWDLFETEYGASRTEYSSWADKGAKADETRSVYWGPDSFFHNPTLEKFNKLIEVHQNEGGKVWIDVGEDEPVEVSRKQAKWQEILVRTIEFGKSKEGKKILEDFAIFGSLEVHTWIKQADDNELITRKQRDFLYRKFLFFPFMSAEGGARRRADIATYLAPFRDRRMRGLIVGGTIIETIKKSLVYIFGE